MRLRIVNLTLTSVVMAFAPALHAAPADVAAAVAAADRPADAIAADASRKPAEVLTFLGLEEGDRVLDIASSTGYFGEIMARAVGPEGSVTGTQPTAYIPDEFKAAWAGISSRSPNAKLEIVDSWDLKLPSGSFDFIMVNSFFHEYYNFDRDDLLARQMFRLLKPGGTLAVIDNVAAVGSDPKVDATTLHRIDPALARAEFEGVGFVLEAESPVLANPSDDRKLATSDDAPTANADRFVHRYRKPL